MRQKFRRKRSKRLVGFVFCSWHWRGGAESSVTLIYHSFVLLSAYILTGADFVCVQQLHTEESAVKSLSEEERLTLKYVFADQQCFALLMVALQLQS